MSENNELKLPSKYKRPSFEKFKATPGYQDYDQDGYVRFFETYEAGLAEAFASGEVTEENFQPEVDDEMTDADHDGLPDILHVRSQVRAPGNRTLRARQPTRHRFKQYLFGNPALRLVRKRATRVRADDVRANLDELISKEAAGILSVHAPNGQRVNLQALKAGQVELGAIPAPAPLVNKPLDSAANDIPAGENMPQYVGGTFAGDPIAADVGARLAAEKQAEAEKKDPALVAINAEDPADPAAPVTDEAKDPVDPSASTQPSPELEQPAAEQPAQEAQPEAAPADPVSEEAKSAKKSSKKGGHK